jgi:Ca2+-binding EF-hand superfamily protein
MGVFLGLIEVFTAGEDCGAEYEAGFAFFDDDGDGVSTDSTGNCG